RRGGRRLGRGGTGELEAARRAELVVGGVRVLALRAEHHPGPEGGRGRSRRRGSGRDGRRLVGQRRRRRGHEGRRRDRRRRRDGRRRRRGGRGRRRGGRCGSRRGPRSRGRRGQPLVGRFVRDVGHARPGDAAGRRRHAVGRRPGGEFLRGDVARQLGAAAEAELVVVLILFEAFGAGDHRF